MHRWRAHHLHSRQLSGPIPETKSTSARKLLTFTDKGVRFPPGYFMAFLRDQSGSVGGKCRIFCSAPDTAKLKNKQDSSQVSQRYTEHGQFIDIPGTFFQVMDTNTTGMHGAIERPVGYANELAIQFDEPSAEIAVVTSSAIQMIRRRRVVDVFAGNHALRCFRRGRKRG